MIKLNFILLFFLIARGCFAQSGGESLCDLNESNMKPLYRKIYENIIQLKKDGKLVFPRQDLNQTSAPTPIRFAWPLREKVHGKFPYYRITNFTDMDTNQLGSAFMDYMGGIKTYNGHQGIDIGLGTYSWLDKQQGNVKVIAAAEGIIVEKHDGEYDSNCDWDTWQGSTGRGNHVVILHNDGSTVSFYMHLKSGSVTGKAIGESIRTGDYIGTVASSGRSTGPHLHFQVNVGWSHPDTAKGTFVEPFAGPHNWTTDESLWVDQPGYYQTSILGMETHYDPYNEPPDYYNGNCDTSINLSNLRNYFTAENWRVGFRAFIIDWTTSANATFYVKDPVGNIVKLWIASNPNYHKWFVNYDTIRLGVNPNVGTWSYNINFNGETRSHYFSVGCNNDYNFSSSHTNNQGFIAGNTITSSATISGSSSNDVEYKADNSVSLLPGFTAAEGCTFLASPDGCERGKLKLIR